MSQIPPEIERELQELYKRLLDMSTDITRLTKASSSLADTVQEQKTQIGKLTEELHTHLIYGQEDFDHANTCAGCGFNPCRCKTVYDRS